MVTSAEALEEYERPRVERAKAIEQALDDAIRPALLTLLARVRDDRRTDPQEAPVTRDSQLKRDKTIAKTILIDHAGRNIYVDGVRLPWYVHSAPTIEPHDSNPKINLVSIELLAENVSILRSLEDDLEWIRELGRDELQAAKLQFKAKQLMRVLDAVVDSRG